MSMPLKTILSFLGVKKEDSEELLLHMEKLFAEFKKITPEQIEHIKNFLYVEYLEYKEMQKEIKIISAYIEKQHVKLN